MLHPPCSGRGSRIRGLHWDAAGEMQQKCSRNAALSRDKGLGKPSSLCLTLIFISHRWFLPWHHQVRYFQVVQTPLSAPPRPSYFEKSAEITLYFGGIRRNNPVAIFPFPRSFLRSGERQNPCSRLPSAGSSSAWLTAGFAALLLQVLNSVRTNQECAE